MANNIIAKLKRLNRRRESERGENTSDGSINKNHDSYDKQKQNKKCKLRDKIVLKVFRIITPKINPIIMMSLKFHCKINNSIRCPYLRKDLIRQQYCHKIFLQDGLLRLVWNED